MKRIKTALFAFILFSILLTSTPAIAANKLSSVADPHLQIADNYFNKDSGMLKTAIPNIDPKMLIPGNTGIDPGMLIAP